MTLATKAAGVGCGLLVDGVSYCLGRWIGGHTFTVAFTTAVQAGVFYCSDSSEFAQWLKIGAVTGTVFFVMREGISLIQSNPASSEVKKTWDEFERKNFHSIAWPAGALSAMAVTSGLCPPMAAVAIGTVPYLWFYGKHREEVVRLRELHQK